MDIYRDEKYSLDLSVSLQLELEMQEFRLSIAVVLLQSEDMPLLQLTPDRSDQQLLYLRVNRCADSCDIGSTYKTAWSAASSGPWRARRCSRRRTVPAVTARMSLTLSRDSRGENSDFRSR